MTLDILWYCFKPYTSYTQPFSIGLHALLPISPFIPAIATKYIIFMILPSKDKNLNQSQTNSSSSNISFFQFILYSLFTLSSMTGHRQCFFSDCPLKACMNELWPSVTWQCAKVRWGTIKGRQLGSPGARQEIGIGIPELEILLKKGYHGPFTILSRTWQA